MSVRNPYFFASAPQAHNPARPRKIIESERSLRSKPDQSTDTIEMTVV